jgi:regulator of protease activity HflC (stomatin/prohibitin superfamily)
VLKTLSGEDAEVTSLNPPPRVRAAATSREHQMGEETQDRAQNSSSRKTSSTSSRKKKRRAYKAPQPQPFMLFGF